MQSAVRDLQLRVAHQEMEPNELNTAITEWVVSAVIQADVDEFNGGKRSLQPLASYYMTLHVLHMIHKAIVRSVNEGACKLAKHKWLGAAVLIATGT